MRKLINIDPTTPPLATAALAVLPSVQTPAQAKAERRHLRRIAARRFVRLEQQAAAIDQIHPLPQPRETLHGVMSGRFSAWSLAEAVLELIGQPVDEMTISTLGFNRQNCDQLVECLDSGTVHNVLLNVSDYFRHSDREIFTDIRRELEQRGQRVEVTRSHAKLMLFRTSSRNIVIETSANLRSSQNWEQFAISDDAELLRFHRRWIEEVCFQ